MLKELVALKPNQAVLREYEDGPVPEGYVRVKVQFGSPKHGTELHMYHGIDPFVNEYFDTDYNLFLPDEKKKEKEFFMGLGNMWVGVITELGKGVSGFKEGQRVAGYGHLKNTQTVPAGELLKMNDGVTWKQAVCYDPAHFALGGVRDGHVRLGDAVAVFGLGAIGLMSVQMARLAGASHIIAADPIEARRNVALKIGADEVVDSSTEDAGLFIKKATNKRGADVVIETSSVYAALQQAIRGVAYAGNVSVVGWYKECKGGIHLGREAHFNQPNIIMSRAVSSPNRDYPRWDFGRITDTCWEMVSKGLFFCEHIVDPVVPFEKSAEAYMEIVDKHPEKSVKLGVEF